MAEEDPLRRGSYVMNQPDGGEPIEHVVAEVDLPPEESLPGGGGIAVMIVVPAFAVGHQGYEE